jgi:DNA-binding response OmpR family regulator
MTINDEGSAKRVLVVDMYVPTAQTLGWQAEMMGHGYKLAHDAHNAKIIAKMWLPHFIVIDLGLPNNESYFLCQVLQEDAELSNAIFIASADFDTARERKRSADAGFHHHLSKPLDAEKLKKIIPDLKAA